MKEPTGSPSDIVDPLTGRRGLLVVLLAGFLALCGLTLLLPTDRYSRYQQLAGSPMEAGVWIYERTQFDRTPIDVAIIGASRLQVGISGPRLEAELSRRLGHRVHVANLALPKDGRDMHYEIARQLLATHPEVKLIVFSAIEHPARIGHPAFRSVSDVGQVLAAPAWINPNYVENIAYLPYRQLAVWGQALAPRLSGLRLGFDPASYRGTDFDGTVSYRSAAGKWVDRDSIHPATELARDARREIALRSPAMLPAAMRPYEFVVEREYSRRIAAMARAGGVRTAFLYLPVYGHAVPIERLPFRQDHVLYLDGGFMARDHRNYSDYGHANRIGTRRATDWLAARLAGLVGLAGEGRLDLGGNPRSRAGRKDN